MKKVRKRSWRADMYIRSSSCPTQKKVNLFHAADFLLGSSQSYGREKDSISDTSKLAAGFDITFWNIFC